MNAGVTLPYSCRTGRCGTCKALLVGGSTSAAHPETGLSDNEKVESWILTCVRSALSDVDLDVADLGDVKLFHPKTLPCRIQSLELVTHDIVRVSLRLPPTSVFDFRPGQYVDVIGHSGARRSYSIANAPREDKVLEFHIRRMPDGVMSRYWFDTAKVNDLLRLHGPLGTFFLRSIEDLDVVFLATGTGIAPIKSMLEALAKAPEAAPRSISTYWGARTSGEFYWDGSGLGSQIRVLSKGESDWLGERGHVQHALVSRGPGLVPDGRLRVRIGGHDPRVSGASNGARTPGQPIFFGRVCRVGRRLAIIKSSFFWWQGDKSADSAFFLGIGYAGHMAGALRHLWIDFFQKLPEQNDVPVLAVKQPFEPRKMNEYYDGGDGPSDRTAVANRWTGPAVC